MVGDVCFEIYNIVMAASCGCGFLSWWVMGMYWRFSPSGSYAAGDTLSQIELSEIKADPRSLFQIRSGRFISIFYVVCWCVIVFAALAILASVLTYCRRNTS